MVQEMGTWQEKEKNASCKHFLLFQQCFFTPPNTIFNFSAKFILLSASSFNLDQSKTLSLDKGLRIGLIMTTQNGW